MDKKLFKTTYPFVCSKCGEFDYRKCLYCNTCGSYNTIRKAKKVDYKKHFNK